EGWHHLRGGDAFVELIELSVDHGQFTTTITVVRATGGFFDHAMAITFEPLFFLLQLLETAWGNVVDRTLRERRTRWNEGCFLLIILLYEAAAHAIKLVLKMRTAPRCGAVHLVYVGSC